MDVLPPDLLQDDEPFDPQAWADALADADTLDPDEPIRLTWFEKEIAG